MPDRVTAAAIYLDDGTTLREMREVQYAAEEVLQQLIVRYPGLLAGVTIAPIARQET